MFSKKLSDMKHLEDWKNAWVWGRCTAYLAVLNNWIIYPAGWESMSTMWCNQVKKIIIVSGKHLGALLQHQDLTALGTT